MTPTAWTADEMMTVAAARHLADGEVCFVGIGLPSTVANLARRTHAPRLVLVYESGTIGSKPRTIPLSIGDGELAETADSVVSVPEIFNYWLQPGRIDVGFLGAAELDRRGDINTTVIGPYDAPDVRLPGAGGAPEIAASCGRVLVVMRQTPRAFVERVGFRTSLGERVSTVITDIGVLERDHARGELVLAALHPGATEGQARAATRWDLAVADDLAETAPPSVATSWPALRHLEATKGPGARARSFAYDALPGRVVFGAGSRASLPPELDALGARRVLVVASADEDDVADDVIGRLGDRVVGRFRDVVQHVPVAAAEAARAATTAAGADTVLTIGGGSATGFGKAVALEQDVRLAAVPTTYAGLGDDPDLGAHPG